MISRLKSIFKSPLLWFAFLALVIIVVTSDNPPLMFWCIIFSLIVITTVKFLYSLYMKFLLRDFLSKVKSRVLPTNINWNEINNFFNRTSILSSSNNYFNCSDKNFLYMPVLMNEGITSNSLEVIKCLHDDLLEFDNIDVKFIKQTKKFLIYQSDAYRILNKILTKKYVGLSDDVIGSICQQHYIDYITNTTKSIIYHSPDYHTKIPCNVNNSVEINSYHKPTDAEILEQIKKEEQETLDEIANDKQYEFEYVLTDDETIHRLVEFVKPYWDSSMFYRNNLHLGYGVVDKNRTVLVAMMYYINDFIKRCGDILDDYEYAVVTGDEVFKVSCKVRNCAIRLNMGGHDEYKNVVRQAINFELNYKNKKAWEKEIKKSNPDFSYYKYNTEVIGKYILGYTEKTKEELKSDFLSKLDKNLLPDDVNWNELNTFFLNTSSIITDENFFDCLDDGYFERPVLKKSELSKSSLCVIKCLHDDLSEFFHNPLEGSKKYARFEVYDILRDFLDDKYCKLSDEVRKRIYNRYLYLDR